MSVKKTRTALLLILMLLAANCGSIFAPDEGELRGIVVSDLGAPVANARVVTDPRGKAVTTDSGGGFLFRNLPADEYTLTVSKPAYESSSVAADLPESGGLSCAAPGATAETIVLSLEGWGFYEGGQFTEAVLRFGDALAEDPDCVDAHNGLGWSYARLDSLERATSSLSAALALEGGLLDALAGLALVSSARNEHDDVISAAGAVLNQVGDSYVFRRDPNVTSADLRLVLAQSYFYTGNLTLAQEQVDIIDPDNGLDAGDPDTWWVDGVQYPSYEEALLVELQLLGR